jgi:hypothetical protein
LGGLERLAQGGVLGEYSKTAALCEEDAGKPRNSTAPVGLRKMCMCGQHWKPQPLSLASQINIISFQKYFTEII